MGFRRQLLMYVDCTQELDKVMRPSDLPAGAVTRLARSPVSAVPVSGRVGSTPRW